MKSNFKHFETRNLFKSILDRLKENRNDVVLLRYESYKFELKYQDVSIIWFPPEFTDPMIYDSVQLVIKDLLNTERVYDTKVVDMVLSFYNELIHPERSTWKYKLIETPLRFLRRQRLKYFYGLK